MSTPQVTQLGCDASARPVGQAPQRINVRAGTQKRLYVGCAQLLRTHELLVKLLVHSGGPIVRALPCQDNTVLAIDLMLPKLAPPAPFEDLSLTLRVLSTQGEVSVAVDLRVLA